MKKMILLILLIAACVLGYCYYKGIGPFEKAPDGNVQIKQEVKDKATELKDKVVEKAEEVKEKAGEMKDKVVEKAGEVKEKAAELTDKAVEKAGEIKDKVMDSMTDTKEESAPAAK